VGWNDVPPSVFSQKGYIVEYDVATDTDGDGVPDDQDNCPDSDDNATVIIDGCDTGVPNVLLDGGCFIADFIASFDENAKNHGQYMKSVAALCNTLKEAGVITGKQQGKIVSCAAKSDVGK
jgi:hypothetical protein